MYIYSIYLKSYILNSPTTLSPTSSTFYKGKCLCEKRYITFLIIFQKKISKYQHKR